LAACNIAEINLLPGETAAFEFEIPQLNGISRNNFNKKTVVISTADDFLDNTAKGIEIVPSIGVVSKNKVTGLVKNSTDMPVRLNEGVEFAKVSLFKAEQEDAIVKEAF
jgi:hypothetical protein